jgi:hypothetical protein
VIPSVNSQICRGHLLHQLHRFLQFGPSAQRRCHAAEAYDFGAAYGSTKEWGDALFSLGNRSQIVTVLSVSPTYWNDQYSFICHYYIPFPLLFKINFNIAPITGGLKS